MALVWRGNAARGAASRRPVTTFPASVRRSILLRSFTVQASFNYRTLIGTGFAFVIAPGIRFLQQSRSESPGEPPSAGEEVFNAHPYLVPLAAGAILRMEADGVDGATTARFKSALRSSLGSLGDRLFWAGWRPATALFGMALLLLGAPWWLAILAFWLPYNALHLGVRRWGLRVGLERGMGIATTLRSAPLARWAEHAATAGAFLAGLCAVLIVAPPAAAPLGWGISAAAAGGGLLLGMRVRGVLNGLLPAAWLVAVASAFLLGT